MNKKIGILYICTGPYDIFWKDFYVSAEKYLLKNHEKHYFVFTDSQKIFDADTNPRIHIIYQKNLERPNNTLKRFHMFLSQEEALQKMDYLYFFNANLEIQTEINEEILPNKGGLLVATHPGFFKKNNKKFTYERNPLSTAYIPKGTGNVYVGGGLNGGDTQAYLTMCKELQKNIDIDRKRGIIALWHDESHLNKYILNNEHTLLDPSYLYPSFLYPWSVPLPFKPKVLLKNRVYPSKV